MTWTPCLPITPVTDDPRPRVVYRTDMLRTLAENSPSNPTKKILFHVTKRHHGSRCMGLGGRELAEQVNPASVLDALFGPGPLGPEYAQCKRFRGIVPEIGSSIPGANRFRFPTKDHNLCGLYEPSDGWRRGPHFAVVGELQIADWTLTTHLVRGEMLHVVLNSPALIAIWNLRSGFNRPSTPTEMIRSNSSP